DDAGGVTDDERHLLRGAVDRGDDQVALVLAPVVVHDDDDLATLEGPQSFDDFLLIIGHGAHFTRRVLVQQNIGNQASADAIFIGGFPRFLTTAGRSGRGA